MSFAPQPRPLFEHLNFQTCSKHADLFFHFEFELCFAPQPRAVFDKLNFQKCSEPEVLLTSKCALRPSVAQPFMSYPTEWLRTGHFGETTFRPSWASKHWKNTVFRNLSTFSRALIFFLLTLSSLTLSLLTLALLTTVAASACESEVWLLNFLR